MFDYMCVLNVFHAGAVSNRTTVYVNNRLRNTSASLPHHFLRSILYISELFFVILSCHKSSNPTPWQRDLVLSQSAMI
jgi:hypothetical protein